MKNPISNRFRNHLARLAKVRPWALTPKARQLLQMPTPIDSASEKAVVQTIHRRANYNATEQYLLTGQPAEERDEYMINLDIQRFFRALSSGDVARKYGHLAGTGAAASAPRTTGKSTVVAGRPGYPPTVMQQRSAEELARRDAGDPLDSETSASAAKLILSAHARARGEKHPDDNDDPDKRDDPENSDDQDQVSRRKRKAKDDDPGDEEKGGDDTESSARARERLRIKAIIESESGRANLAMALYLSLETGLAASDAVALLDAMTALAPQAQHLTLTAWPSKQIRISGLGMPAALPT